MRAYEALVILKSSGTEQDIAKHAAQLEEPIKKVGGAIESSQGMGRRRLAYRIARQTEGHYYLLRFKAPTKEINELKRLLRLNDTIVRFMILTDENTTPWAPGSGRSEGATASAGRGGYAGSGRGA